MIRSVLAVALLAAAIPSCKTPLGQQEGACAAQSVKAAIADGLLLDAVQAIAGDQTGEGKLVEVLVKDGNVEAICAVEAAVNQLEAKLPPAPSTPAAGEAVAPLKRALIAARGKLAQHNCQVVGKAVCQ